MVQRVLITGLDWQVNRPIKRHDNVIELHSVDDIRIMVEGRVDVELLLDIEKSIQLIEARHEGRPMPLRFQDYDVSRQRLPDEPK